MFGKFKTEVFMKEKVKVFTQGLFLATLILTVLVVEVSFVSSTAKVLRAEKNFKTIQSI